MWFVLTIIGYLLLAFVFVLDKRILDKSLDKPIIYTFYSTIYMLGVLALLPFTSDWLQDTDWLWALVSGLSFGIGLWTMFIAVNYGSPSRINPFIGGLIAVCILFLSQIFLGESFTLVQMIGIFILILATFFLAFMKSKHWNGFHRGFLWAILSAICFAISHVSAKYIYDHYEFLTGFVWTRAAIGIIGLVVLFSPVVRKSFHKTSSKTQRIKNKQAAFYVILDKVFAASGVVLIQYAISLGSVTIITAMAGLQYAFMFVMILFFSKYSPQFYREKYSKRELSIETLALILVIVGSICIVPGII